MEKEQIPFFDNLLANCTICVMVFCMYDARLYLQQGARLYLQQGTRLYLQHTFLTFMISCMCLSRVH